MSFSRYRQRTILALIAAFYILNGFLSFYLIDSTRSAVLEDKNAVNILLNLESLGRLIVSAETAQRGYLITGERTYLSPYISAKENLPDAIQKIRDAMRTHGQFPQHLDALDTVIGKKFNEMQKTLDLFESGLRTEAVSRVNSDVGFELMTQVSEQLADLKSDSIEHISSSNALSEKRLWTSLFFIAPTSLIGVGLVLFYLRSHENSIITEQGLTQSLQESHDKLEQRVESRTRELLLKSQELESSNQELENFAYVASHDLQEPLRKIRAFSDRLITNYQNQLDEKGADYLERMRLASERMSKLIEDLLAFSRISSREHDSKPVDLFALIEGAVNDYSDDLADINGNIYLKDLPVVHGDTGQLLRVFVNVIGNAVKYRSTDRDLKVYIYGEELDIESTPDGLINPNGNGFFAIYIEDNGIGFSEKHSEKIFSMFQRLHGRTEYQGTGIGLAICRKIVERHNGFMRVYKAEPDCGATFVIYLPK